MSITIQAATPCGGGTATVTSGAATFTKNGTVRTAMLSAGSLPPSSPLYVSIQTSIDSVTYVTQETRVLNATAPGYFHSDFQLSNYAQASVVKYKVLFSCAGSPAFTVSAIQD